MMVRFHFVYFIIVLIFYPINICYYLNTDDSDPNARLKSVNKETQAVLDTLNKEYKAPEKKEVKSEKADKFNAVRS